MGKAPSFQFYPADWLSDFKLQSCSQGARGLLIDLMCLMHQSKPYGKLKINGVKVEDKTIIKLLKVHHKTYYKRLKELLSTGALCQDESGVIYSKRMVEDERIRELRREAGKLGGNPNFGKGKPNPYYKDKQKDNQGLSPKITPSSSSSSSSSSSKDKKKINKEMPPDFNLTNKLRKYAFDKNVPAHEIEDMFEHFKNHHLSKGNKYKDWNRAWYNWVLSPYNKDRRKGGNYDKYSVIGKDI